MEQSSRTPVLQLLEDVGYSLYCGIGLNSRLGAGLALKRKAASHYAEAAKA